MDNTWGRARERERQRGREAISRGREFLRGDWRDRSPQELCDVWLAAVAACSGDEIAEKSLTFYGHGWFTVNVARRFQDGSIGCVGRLDSVGSIRRDAMVEHIEELLRRAAKGENTEYLSPAKIQEIVDDVLEPLRREAEEQERRMRNPDPDWMTRRIGAKGEGDG